MMAAQWVQGAEGQERWGEACVGASWSQGSGSVGKRDGGEGGSQEAWSWRIPGWSRWRGRFEVTLHVEPASRNRERERHHKRNMWGVLA